MKSRDEWEAEQERLLEVYEAVRDELSQIPGVVEVGVGLRRRGDELVEEAVFIVSVKEKLPESAVPPKERIPKTIRGFPTDVQVFQEPKPLIGFDDEDDAKNYSTKVGGIAIGAEGSGGKGTLGCFCRQNSDSKVVMLSNHHVLLGGSAKIGSGVGQPRHQSSCCCTCNEIGKVVKADKNLDCAIATLNTGVAFFPKIKRIKKGDGTVEEEGLINGVADPVLNQAVWKVGHRTGLTRGTVSKITPRVELTVSAPFARVVNRGDSGSVAVEKASGNVIGLIYAMTDEGGTIALAKKITAVQAVMDVTVIVSDPTAVYTERMLEEDEEAPFSLPAASPLEALVERLHVSVPGRELLELFDRHRAECLELVNERRAFTVAWHRNFGPAWLAALGRSAREPIYRIPEHIEGVSRAVAARTIVEALRREASEPLRRDLELHRSFLVDAFDSSSTVDEMLERLELELVRA